jgi:hypothetical protein
LACSDWPINPEDYKKGWSITDTERKRKDRETLPEKHLPVLLPYLRHWGLWYQSSSLIYE